MYIRAVGAEDFDYLDHNDDELMTSNVYRLTFAPGCIWIFQHHERPRYTDRAILESDLYLWKATFKAADLHDIRLTEYRYGAEKQIRIEIWAVSKAPPTGCGLVARAGTQQSNLPIDAEDTSDTIASNLPAANLSDRWASGEQEIKLTFTRSTQIAQKPEPNKVQTGTEPVRGPEVWVWKAFMSLLCGKAWSLSTFEESAVLSLDQVVTPNMATSTRFLKRRLMAWF